MKPKPYPPWMILLLLATSSAFVVPVMNVCRASCTAEQGRRSLLKMIEDGGDPSTDYARIIEKYLDSSPCNATALFDTHKHWREQTSIDHPDPQVGVRIIRTVANEEVRNWAEALERIDITTKLGSIVLSDINVANGPDNGSSSTEEGKEEFITEVYAGLLEVCSKLLPPPSKQKTFDKFLISEKERNIVGERTRAVIIEMGDAGIKPTMSIYASSLYAYCKCGWLEEAWDMWEAWKLAIQTNREEEGSEALQLDVRSLQMLIQSSLVEAEEAPDTHPSQRLSPVQNAIKATDAVKDMWEMYDQGFLQFKPDTNLHTSILRCWSCPRLKSLSMDSARFLVDDLLHRYQATKDTEIRPDMNLYRAFTAVVRTHFGNTTLSVPDQAGFILQQMEDDALVVPDTSSYNFLIDACLSDGSWVGFSRAEQTLSKMLEAEPSASNSPNGRSFASIIRAALKYDTAIAEKWLDRMEERFIPSRELFELVILRCCEETTTTEENAERKKQAQRARRLLNRMEQLSQATRNAQLEPDTSLYSCVSEASDACGILMGRDKLKPLKRKEGMKKSARQGNSIIKSKEDIFRLMKEVEMISSGDEEKIDLDTLKVNKLIVELTNAGNSPNPGEVAEEIFAYALHEYVDSANVKLKPDAFTFNSVISAWSKSPHRDAAEKAEKFFRNLDNLHKSGILLDVEQDLISFNTVLAAYQRSAKPNSAEEAERIFNELQKDPRCQPDAVSLCCILGAFASKGDCVRAEELLLHFWKEHKVHHNQVAPNTACFDQVLRAWAKSNKRDGARRAEMLLELMEDLASTPNSNVKPTTITYNIVLSALKNNRDMDATTRAQRANKLLGQMKTKAGGRKPDTITYTTAIGVMSRLPGKQALEKIEELMEEAVNAPGVKVDSTFFANVLSSLAFCGDHGVIDFGKDLVDKMAPVYGVEPDIFVWNALLNCYAKRGMGEEAEAILEQLQRARMPKPNSVSFFLVLDAFAKSDGPNSVAEAERIIEWMQESKHQPDAKVYTALIQCIARSNLPLKSKRAQAVLETMKMAAEDGFHEAKPSVISYNCVLNACEYTNSTDLQEKEEAFTVACLVFDEVQKEVPSIGTTHTTFGSFLGVIANLMPRSEARNEIAELVFKRCCKDGQVSPYVLRKLKTAVSLSLYRQMLGGRRESKLPRKWTVNVRERKNEGFVGHRRNRKMGKTSSTMAIQ